MDGCVPELREDRSLNWLITMGCAEKMPFGERLERGEGVSSVDT